MLFGGEVFHENGSENFMENNIMRSEPNLMAPLSERESRSTITIKKRNPGTNGIPEFFKRTRSDIKISLESSGLTKKDAGETPSVEAHKYVCMTDRGDYRTENEKNWLFVSWTSVDKKDKKKKDEELPKIEKKQEVVVEDDVPCYICFSDQPNSVLLNCGHGGICVDCAIDSMKKNNCCFLCREIVYQIIEIDLEKQVEPGLFKVLNSYYVSKEDK